jgi:GT2 family glycosyltransferase
MNMAFRKDAFDKYGLFSNDFGYHKGIYAEDNEISKRFKLGSGGKIQCMPRAKVWHRVHNYRFSWRFIRDRSLWIGRSRKALRKESFQLKGEKALLGRIVTNLIPRTLLLFFTKPVVAWNKLRVTVLVLFFIAVGYIL